MRFTGRRPPEIDLKLPGLDAATGRVAASERERDRFRVSSETREPTVYRARCDMIRDLAQRFLWPVLKARLEGAITTEELHAAYRKGEAALARLVEAHRHARLQPLVREYLAGHAIKSLSDVEQHLTRFLAYVGSAATVEQFTPAVIEAFLTQLVRQSRGAGPASNATRNRYRGSLYGFASWLVARGVLQKHPLAYKQVRRQPEGARRLPDLTPDEQRRYLAAVDAHGGPTMRLLAETALTTGADVGELIETADNAGEAIRVRDCYFDGPQARLRFKRHKVSKSLERLVPVPSMLALRLRAHVTLLQLAPNDLVFAGILDSQFRTAHEAAREVIGRPTLTRKDLRHVAAINWRRAGADLHQVKEWLGHTSITQTVIYQDFLPDDEFDGRVMAQLEARAAAQPAALPSVAQEA